MKKFLAIILALVMVLSLAACGGSGTPAATAEPEATEEPAPEVPETPVEEAVDVSGVYYFAEISDMGSSLWILTLNADGTYTVQQNSPFGDETCGDGTYTVENGIVSCSGIDAMDFYGATPASGYADRLMGEFVGEDMSTQWTLDGDTCVPVGYEGEVGDYHELLNGGGAQGGMPEGLDFTVAGVYTWEEESDMGLSLWTLDLHPDMTYSIQQDSPFGDKTVGEGTYTYEGNVVSCSGIDPMDFHGATEADGYADRLMGEFVGEDNSTVWVLDQEAMTMLPQE